jgi:hypothetical protein
MVQDHFHRPSHAINRADIGTALADVAESPWSSISRPLTTGKPYFDHLRSEYDLCSLTKHSDGVIPL